MGGFETSKFNNGASYLVSDNSYKQYCKNQKSLGREDNKNGNLFCAPSDEIDMAIANSNGDIHKLEAQLGLDEGALGDGPIHRIDINNPFEHNLREATGEETGANCFFNTPRDDDGNLPHIEFLQELDKKSNEYVTARDAEGREIIDVEKTSPEEIAKLRGRYATSDGVKHDADLTGYEYTTSGGIYEGVTDQILNTPDNVSYWTIEGWGKGKNGELRISLDNEAYPKLETSANEDLLEKNSVEQKNARKIEEDTEQQTIDQDKEKTDQKSSELDEKNSMEESGGSTDSSVDREDEIGESQNAMEEGQNAPAESGENVDSSAVRRVEKLIHRIIHERKKIRNIR